MKDYSQLPVDKLTDQEINARVAFLSGELQYFEKEKLLIVGELNELQLEVEKRKTNKGGNV